MRIKRPIVRKDFWMGKFKNHYKMTYCDNILDLQYAN